MKRQRLLIGIVLISVAVATISLMNLPMTGSSYSYYVSEDAAQEMARERAGSSAELNSTEKGEGRYDYHFIGDDVSKEIEVNASTGEIAEFSIEREGDESEEYIIGRAQAFQKAESALEEGWELYRTYRQNGDYVFLLQQDSAEARVEVDASASVVKSLIVEYSEETPRDSSSSTTGSPDLSW